MKNLCFRAIAMVLGLYFTGTMTNPARKSSIFFNSECQWNGYRLTNCSFTGKQDMPVDISQTAATVNASSILFKGLFQPPTNEGKRNIKHLDLSNNLMLEITLSPLAHFPGLETLNLSNNAIRSISLDLPRPGCSWGKRHRSSLGSGLPHLKLLVLRRNKLSDIPKGLWKLKSLQSLDLSFNGILKIGVFDFHNCLQLENLYLRSNKIFRIYPEAFKDLKKLQVVDLSSNALTTILPMMTIALELPHLEADLAHNQWQCDDSVTVFQNVISESWKRKWEVICNKSIGPEEAHWWTPRSRIPREAQLPHTNLSHTRSLIGSKAERPQEGMHVGSATQGQQDHAGSEAPEQHRRPPRRVRSTQDGQAAGGTEAASQHLALAVCLAVFITFFVAFCLGAWTRPYMDRLWQQRCRKKRLSSDLGYSNEGYCDEADSAGDGQHPGGDLHQAPRGLSLWEPRHPFSGTRASPQAAVTAGSTRGPSREEPGGRQGSGHRGAEPGAGRKRDNVLPNGRAACSAPRGRSDADSHPLTERDRACRSGVRGEVDSETEAQEGAPRGHSMGIPGIAGSLSTGSGSIHQDSNALGPPLSREITAALSKMQMCTEAPGTGGREDTQDELDTDSDEGSLFTLSSGGSEGVRNGSDGEADGEESSGTSEPPEDGDPEGRKDTASQKAQGECENQEDRFGQPLISHSDSSVDKSHRESTSDTHKFENPESWPGSPGESAARDTTPGMSTSDCIPAPQSEAAGWHRSLRDLEFSTVETPPCSAEAPPDPGKTARGERDADIGAYEPCTPGSDTDENNSPPQYDSEGGSTHASPMGTGAHRGRDSREAMSPTQLLQFPGGKPGSQGREP
ncbi:leucine-rich repeat-containing protein 66 [Pipistrellus kuhlii]|uniref:leucine-rich repeat-containing protein 66 n=1 Tax=Pipistrellus kuhlii TaxID=59472 RepID=UPI001E272D76|nr:leucine-rich repeat-containing protein 66 [Pipistrellus kuhlii]